MIVFKELKMQNFLSYGNAITTINLNPESPILVTGINYDASVNGELDSNGSGKSTILNAISYVLYNKAISISEKLDDLINNINKKDMFVTITLTKNKTSYRITRYRKNKAMGGDGVLIEQKKGKSWKDITTTKPDVQISEQILGIPYSIFNRIIGYAAGEKAFLKQSLGEQREVIDELFEYTELTKRAAHIKERVKDLKKDLEYAKDSDASIKEESERHSKQLKDVEQRMETWEREHEENIASLTETISKLSAIDFDNEESKIEKIEDLKKDRNQKRDEYKILGTELKALRDTFEKYASFGDKKQAKLEKFRNNYKELTEDGIDVEHERNALTKLAEHSEALKRLSTEIQEKESEAAKLKKDHKKLETELAHLDDEKCPYCLQQYEDAKSKVEEVKRSKNVIQKELHKIEKTVADLQGKRSTLNDEYESLKDSCVFEDERELDNYVSTVAEMESKIKDLEESENPYEDVSDQLESSVEKLGSLTKDIEEMDYSIEKMENKLYFSSSRELYQSKADLDSKQTRLEEKKNESNPYVEMLEEVKKYQPKKGKGDEIEKLAKEIKHCEFLVKLLTKKDSYLRKALMDKYLPMLNKRLHHYLTAMSLPHKVVFESDLSTKISQFGQGIPYGNLSAGQKARINIALSLAFRDVLQSKHNFINLFVLDECLDVGLSNVGVKKTVKAIKEVATANKLSMFVISHRDEAKDSFPRKLEIELRNGFSSVTSQG